MINSLLVLLPVVMSMNVNLVNPSDDLYQSSYVSFSDDLNWDYYKSLPEENGVRDCGTKLVMHNYSLIGHEYVTGDGYVFRSLRRLGVLSDRQEGNFDIALSTDTAFHLHTTRKEDLPAYMTGYFNTGDDFNCQIEEQVEISRINLHEVRANSISGCAPNYDSMEIVIDKMQPIREEFDIYKFKFLIGEKSWDVRIKKPVCSSGENDLYSIIVDASREEDGIRTNLHLIHKNVANAAEGYNPDEDERLSTCIYSLECILSTIEEVS